MVEQIITERLETVASHLKFQSKGFFSSHCRNKNAVKLTLNGYGDFSSGYISNAIICSTSVESFILFTSDGQRHGENTVERKSCPGDGWCWLSIC